MKTWIYARVDKHGSSAKSCGCIRPWYGNTADIGALRVQALDRKTGMELIRQQVFGATETRPIAGGSYLRQV